MPKKGEKKQAKTASAKTKSVSKKQPAKKRVRKLNSKEAKLIAKKETRSRAPMPNSFMLVGHSFSVLKRFWRPLLGIAVVYSALNIFFDNGLLGNISSVVSDINNNQYGLINGFNALISNTNSAGNSSIPAVLLIFESLVIIYALRHLFSGEKVNVKQTYYQSMTPLIPFILVLFVLALQLLPLAGASGALSVLGAGLFSDNIALGVLFIVIAIALTYWSLYMITSSIFAIYIVTLPKVQPLHALRSAKNLVRFRRWQIIRRLLFLPLFIFLLMGAIVIPLIALASFLVLPVFFALSMLSILFAHTYLYSLYKGLLK